MYQNPNSTAIEHACRMLMHRGDKVTIINEKVQRQVGGSDCALFALAFARDLCHGLNPKNQKYHQGSMQKHYISCLENAAMVPFPKTEKRVPSHLDCKKSFVSIFCECRPPKDRAEYVQCHTCRAWYHPTCVNIPEWAVNTKRRWRCSKCKGNTPLCPLQSNTNLF